MKYYSVEQVSDMLSMHPKTIQRYIREGKLRANKVGKSWRITGHDLSIFAESTCRGGSDTIMQQRDKVVVSSVIDIHIEDFDEGIRIANALTALLNSKPQEYGKSTMYVQQIEYEDKVRVTLWGNLDFMREMTDFISVMTNQTDLDTP